MKRRISAISLLLAMTVPAVGTFCWLQYQKSQVRHTLKVQLLDDVKKEDLVLLKFAEDEAEALRWERDDEFEYNGQMYDVVQTATSGDTVSYWCWWDHEETQLNQQLAEMVSNTLDSDTQRSDKQQHLLVYFKSLFSHAPADWEQMSAAGPSEPPQGFSWSLIAHSSEPPTPPPRLS